MHVKRRLAAFAALVVAFLVAFAGPAWAHASLESQSPVSGQHFDTPPAGVKLDFSEPVELSLGAIKVTDAARHAVKTGKPEHAGSADTVRVSLPTLGDGSYLVSWRVISADSHPVSGAFVFVVGSANADAATLLAAADRGGGSRGVGIALGSARALSYASLAVLIGGGVFLATLWPAGASTRRVKVALLAAWIAGIVAALAGIALQGAYGSSGGFGDAFRPHVWRSVLDTRFGRAWLARAVILAASVSLWRVLPRRALRASRVIAAVAAVALAATVAWGGHASVGTWVAAGSIAAAVHVLAMSVWLGGLLFLLLAWFDHAVDRRTIARRFSAIALGSVAVLVASGVVQAWRELPSLSSFTDTTYGRLLLTKLFIVAGILAVASMSRQLAQRIRSGRSSKLIDAVRLELFGAVGVVIVTAVLVAATPPRSAAATVKPFEARRVVGDMTVDVIAERPVAGDTQLHIYLTPLASDSRPVDEITVTLNKPPEVQGPVRVDLLAAGPGHYASDGLFVPFSGAWTLDLALRFGEFDQERASIPITFR
jgi:copper transport protein